MAATAAHTDCIPSRGAYHQSTAKQMSLVARKMCEAPEVKQRSCKQNKTKINKSSLELGFNDGLDRLVKDEHADVFSLTEVKYLCRKD